MWLNSRSSAKELLDLEEIDTNDLYRNLEELHVINKYLGGYNATLKGVRPFMKSGKTLNILDLGFGGGDTIREMAKGSEPQTFFYGVDLKNDCYQYASANLHDIENKTLICDDYRNLSPELLEKVDVVHCSLFLHHLTDDEIVGLFRFCRQNNCVLVVNDLHRHWLAYHSIKLLTRVFSKSYLVKNDAPLSVKRGFKRKELVSLLKNAGYTNYSVRWSWAFRFIVTASS